jgi:tetratricopeptide (TPR) repeat protein
MTTRSWTHGPLALVRAAGIALMIAAVAGPALAASADEERSQRYLREAQDLFAKRDLNAAVIQLKNALKSDAGNVPARLLLAEIYLRLGQGAYAEKELTVAHQRGAPFGDVLTNLARAYMQQGQFDKVLDEITLEKAGDAHRIDALVARGDAQLGKRSIEEAEQSFREALELKPDEVRALAGLAQCLGNRGKLADAEQLVDKALAIDANYVDALVLKGELRRNARDLAGALPFFERAVAERPTSLIARLSRAATLIDLNREAEADPDLRTVLSLMPKHPMARYLHALSLAKRKDYAGARDVLQDTGTALDDHMPALFLRGVVAYALNQPEQAITNLARYVERSPRNLRARKILAGAYLRTNQPGRVIDLLDSAVKTEPNDAQLQFMLGSAYMQRNEADRATEHFERAAEIAPDVALIRTQLGLSHLAQGQSREAESELEVALDLDKDSRQAMPDNPVPLNIMGAAHVGKGDLAKAREMFGEAVRKKSDFTVARVNLAQLDLREGRIDDAKKGYADILKYDTRSAAALMGLANLALRERKTDEAQSWLVRASDANPRAVVPQLQLIALYNQTGQQQKALAVARELNVGVPGNARVLEALGRSEFAAGNAPAAIDAFRRLTQLQPNSAQAHTLLAAAQASSGDAAGARVSFARAIESDTKSTQAYVALAELEMREQHWDDALKVAARVRQALPESAVGDLIEGDVRLRQRSYDAAYAAYEAGLKKENNVTLVLRRFAAQRAAQKRDAAYAELEAWVDANDNASARNMLASSYINDGIYPKAIQHTERLLAVEQDNPVLLNNLAWLYQETGDARASALAERAYARAPQSPAIMDTLGWILVRNGETTRGVELLREAAAKAPNQGDIRFHMAAALAQAGNAAEAKKELEDILGGAESLQNFTKRKEAEALLQKLTSGG